MPRYRVLFLLPILLLLSLPLLAAEEGSFDRTLKVTGPVDLDVTTGSGHITVRTGGAGTVSVHGIIRASEGWSWFAGGSSAADRIKAIQTNPPIEQNGNSIRVGYWRDESLGRNISIAYELVLPPETRLRSRTGSGDQNVTGVHGPVEISSGSGRLHVADISTNVRASTGSGGIDVNDIGGSVRAHAGSGSITGSRIGLGAGVETRAKYQGKALPLAAGAGSATSASDLDFQTGSGAIRVDAVRGRLSARTGSGSIRLDGQPTGDWNLGTGSGSVTVRLPAQAAFYIYAHTSSGNITVDHPVTTQGNLGRHEFRGAVRGGGFHLDVHTGSGDIRVE